MRLSMMPTAKKKMSGMGMFMSRHTEGTHSGPTSPRQGTTSVAPAQPAPQPALQPAPQLVTSRHEIAAAAKIPIPRGGRFGFTTTTQNQNQQQQQQQTAQPAMINQLLPSQLHPLQRSRTSDQGREPAASQHPNGGIWEDSTVASMFEETDSRAGSDRLRSNHGRTHSETMYTRPVAYHERQHSRDELPFTIGKDGMLKVVPHGAANGPSATTLNTDAQSDILEQDPYEEAYEEDQQHDLTPKRSNTLRRTKLPHRDTRDIHRKLSIDHRPTGISSPPNGSIHGSIQDSPGRKLEQAVQLDARLEEARKDEELRDQQRANQRERGLNHKRSTVFENLTPIEDPTFITQGAVGVPTPAVARSEESKEPVQRITRPTTAAPRLQISRPSSRQALAGQNQAPQQTALVRGASLTRTSSRRQGREPTRKRQRSPDYNDAELNAMSYQELMKQDFDYDPQTAALQHMTIPSGNSIEDKLSYYKDKDSLDQHRFFTQVSIKEWEESGDWFLDQFSSIVDKMKDARKNKRNVVSQFENEINEREEAVRSKMEGIGRTLQELRQEGQTMMKGKDVDA